LAWSRMGCVERRILLLLSPIWAPFLVALRIRRWVRCYPYVRGDIEVAWERCAAYWLAVGAMLKCFATFPFPDQLVERLALRHRARREFFVGKLLDPNPLLAAYAIRCLAAVGPIREDDVPGAALARGDEFKVRLPHWYGTDTVGSYIRECLVAQSEEGAVSHGSQKKATT
jgi:hypothetical protein